MNGLLILSAVGAAALMVTGFVIDHPAPFALGALLALPPMIADWK